MEKLKKCKYCGEVFAYRTNNQVHCKKLECRRAHERYLYNEVRVTKSVCQYCGKEYLIKGGISDTICKECHRKHKAPYQFKKVIEQKHICRQCGELLYVLTKNVTNDSAEIVADKTCDKCKENNRQKTSERMKLDNPRYDKQLTKEEYADKITERARKIKEQEETRDARLEAFKLAASKRMKENNPMKNADSIKKMVATAKLTRDKYYKQKPKVMDCKEAMRDYIHFWRKENLERADYQCELCGAKDCKLYVHHSKIKFKDIYLHSCTKLGLNSAHIEYRSEKYYRLKEEIVNYHKENKDLGQVLCKECHAKVDPHFRIKINGGNNNEKTENKHNP